MIICSWATGGKKLCEYPNMTLTVELDKKPKHGPWLGTLLSDYFLFYMYDFRGQLQY